MFRYNEGGEIIEIIIRDSTGAKIDTYKFQLRDKRAKQILNKIMKKYGMKDVEDKDIEWLKKQEDW
jgi:hypothetical protein